MVAPTATAPPLPIQPHVIEDDTIEDSEPAPRFGQDFQMFRPITPDGTGGEDQNMTGNNDHNDDKAGRRSDDEQTHNRNRSRSGNQTRGLSREIRNLNTKYNQVILPQGRTRELRSLNTEYNPINIPTRSRNTIPANNIEISMFETHDTMIFTATLSSDPGEPATYKLAMSGPESAIWKISIRQELMNFLSRKAWKKV